MCRSAVLAILVCACVAPAQEPAAPVAGGGVLRPSTQALPGEEIAPGRALVELLRPLPLPPEATLVEGVLPSAPPAPMRELGGVPVRLLRSIYSGLPADGGEDPGPQLLLV